MRVLIGCEESGVVRDAFRANGHEAFSCDISPSRTPSSYHIEGDLLDVMFDQPWDMMIAHPPCTYLSGSGLHWNKRRPERERLTHEAVMFFIQCWEAPIKKICLENPVGCISTILRKPDQIIQPYQFGEDASKKTCLWLKGLPKLEIHPDQYYPPRWVCPECGAVSTDEAANNWLDQKGRPCCHRCIGGTPRLRPRWSNQTDSGQNRLGPSPTRRRERSTTYPGIAKAMAEAWS